MGQAEASAAAPPPRKPQLAFDSGVNGVMLNSTEIFDPTTGTFAPGGTLAEARAVYERDRCAARDRRTDYRADFNADGFAYQRHAHRDSHPDRIQHVDCYSDTHRPTATATPTATEGGGSRTATATPTATATGCYRYQHGERDCYCHAYARAGEAEDQADVIEVRHREGRES